MELIQTKLHISFHNINEFNYNKLLGKERTTQA